MKMLIIVEGSDYLLVVIVQVVCVMLHMVECLMALMIVKMEEKVEKDLDVEIQSIFFWWGSSVNKYYDREGQIKKLFEFYDFNDA